MNEYQLLIPCAFGIEAVVARQLARLGYPDCKAEQGRISLKGNDLDIARLNVFLASAERVLIVLQRFEAVTFDELYDNIRSFNWGEYLSPHAKILLDGKSVGSTLFAVKSVCSVSKKAIVDNLTEHYHTELNQKGERTQIEVAIYRNSVTVCLDTSGAGLHKRGYRSLAYSAPLKETTAAALIDLSYFNPEKQLADLFCGSGTIPIEAALRACNMAVNAKRDFDFINFTFFDKNALSTARKEAADLIKIPANLNIFAGDILPEAVSIARYHAKRAGVDKYIRFKDADFREFSSINPYGILISNLPYGERIGEAKQINGIHTDLGVLYRKLPKWNFYILTNSKSFERQFKRTADKKRTLYNANIECTYYTFASPKPPKPERNGN